MALESAAAHGTRWFRRDREPGQRAGFCESANCSACASGCSSGDEVSLRVSVRTAPYCQARVQNSCEDSSSILASTGVDENKEGVPKGNETAGCVDILSPSNKMAQRVRIESRSCFEP